MTNLINSAATSCRKVNLVTNSKIKCKPRAIMSNPAQELLEAAKCQTLEHTETNVEHAYKLLCKTMHPDRGGTTAGFQRLQQMYAGACAALNVAPPPLQLFGVPVPSTTWHSGGALLVRCTVKNSATTTGFAEAQFSVTIEKRLALPVSVLVTNVGDVLEAGGRGDVMVQLVDDHAEYINLCAANQQSLHVTRIPESHNLVGFLNIDDASQLVLGCNVQFDSAFYSTQVVCTGPCPSWLPQPLVRPGRGLPNIHGVYGDLHNYVTTSAFISTAQAALLAAAYACDN